MKKICIDARMFYSSGIGVYLQNLLAAFLKIKDFACKTVLLVRPQDFDDPKIALYEKIIASSSIYSVQEQIFLPLQIPSSDLFWSPHYNIPLLPIRAKKRLVTIHDIYHLAHFSSLNWKEKIYVKTVLFQAFKKADRIITPSNFSLQEMIRFFPQVQEKITVVHNGIDQDFFVFNKNDAKTLDLKQKIKKKYRLPEKFFLYVGNIKPHKNIVGVLKSFELAKKNFSVPADFGLVMVGKRHGLINAQTILPWTEEAEIFNYGPAGGQDIVNHNKKFWFLENVQTSELPIFYHLASSLVFPSFYEGFGLPALEALSAGCPVIASNNGSLKEVCLDAAYYVDPYQIDEIALAMKILVEDEGLKNSLKQKGLIRSKNFSLEKMAQKHVQIIQELLD